MFRLGAGIAAGAMVARKIRTSRKARAASRPNILFMMTDQQRGDCLGADGNHVIHTPNLDRIANEGTRFKHGYSCVPSCTPARAALLTGLGPWRNGMLGYSRVPERYQVEMPRILAQNGYHTCGIGKMHWHPQRNAHGFHNMILDESGRELSPDFKSDYRAWFSSVAPNLDPDATGIGWNSYRAGTYQLPEELHPTVWTASTAVNFLNTYEQDKPFFLKVSFARPHSPYDPPERFWKQYKDADLPERFIGDWCDSYAERSGDDDTIWHGDLGPEQARRSRQGYYGSVSFIDEQIGRIIEALEARGDLENTIIVFTSDHGDMLGDHHHWRKTYAYEPSARVPFMVRLPESMGGGKRGHVSDAPVELRDILPTFLDAAGVESPIELDGRSMVPLANADDSNKRAYIDLEHDTCYSPRNHWSALTDGKTKYIFHARDGHEQLFDLVNDPGEVHDLAGVSSASRDLHTWRGRLIDHLAERGEAFVKNGELALRPDSMRHSPHYPETTA
jgi:arylsulfatase